MNEHSIFYFPYASFTNAQLPLMKVAALYFDKLVIVGPIEGKEQFVGRVHIEISHKRR